MPKQTYAANSGQLIDHVVHDIRTDRTAVKAWLDSHSIDNFRIASDGIVNVNGPVTIKQYRTWNLPLQFGEVRGRFNFFRGSSVVTFEGFPHTVRGMVDLSTSEIKCLHGIDKIMKRVDGTFATTYKATHLLGLLLIEGIIKIDIDDGGQIDAILNKYVGTGDIISAQDELLDAGFKDQARL
jgi:hypothetical protein